MIFNHPLMKPKWKRKTAEFYLRIYVDYTMAMHTGMDVQVVLRGNNILAMLDEGFGQGGAGLTGKLLRLDTENADFKTACQLIDCLTGKQKESVLQWGFLQGVTPEGYTRPLKSMKDVAEYVSVEYQKFTKYVYRGYDKMNVELGGLIA